MFCDKPYILIENLLQYLNIIITFHFRTKEQEDKKANWRDSFLIERGKMTTDRYNKIRNALPPVAIDFSWSIKTPY